MGDCLHTCLLACTPLECTERMGEAIGSSGTGLADGGNCHAGPGNIGWVLWKNSQLSQLLRHLSSLP